MSTLEMKEEIKEVVENLKDKTFLKMVYDFVVQKENNFPPLKLSASQKASIKRGLADVKAGRVISHKEAEKELDKWLPK